MSRQSNPVRHGGPIVSQLDVFFISPIKMMIGHGNPVSRHGNPVNRHGNPVIRHGNPVIRHGNPIVFTEILAFHVLMSLRIMFF